ncbi:MAG TPA: hypothetical protein VLH40_07565, partial [Atribacteraceae bacterium]|nr:hypothetical protein [Atribacteraceae bacterium]
FTLSPLQLARYVDHTLLRPDAPTSAFDQLCEEALTYGFYAVCVNACRVGYVAKRLQGTAVKICSVVGFPLGAVTSRSKAFEHTSLGGNVNPTFTFIRTCSDAATRRSIHQEELTYEH